MYINKYLLHFITKKNKTNCMYPTHILKIFPEYWKGFMCPKPIPPPFFPFPFHLRDVQYPNYIVYHGFFFCKFQSICGMYSKHDFSCLNCMREFF